MRRLERLGRLLRSLGDGVRRERRCGRRRLTLPQVCSGYAAASYGVQHGAAAAPRGACGAACGVQAAVLRQKSGSCAGALNTPETDTPLRKEDVLALRRRLSCFFFRHV